MFRVFRNFSAADGCFSILKVQPRSPLCDPFRALLRTAGERMQITIKGPGARFSKVPVTFRARSYIVKSKSINVVVVSSPHISPTCFIILEFYDPAFKANKIWVLNANIAHIK